MSVSDVTGTQSIYDQINAQNQSGSTTTTSSSSEDSEMFMKLMIAQLQNQDPTSPAETSEFMQQIASMSTVENIAKLNTTMETMAASLLSSQATLQASSMIGQDIYAKTDMAQVAESGEIRGVVELPVSTENLRVSIYDSNNNLVDEVEMGSQAAGDQYFVWSAGDRPAGDYRVVAEAQVDGNYATATSYIAYNVNSVTLGQNGIGMKVNTDAGSVDFTDVKRIG
ncbi:flagellar biosynthesis protein FlgD [Amphritea opalescens]|uniref:Basal-body rod modification protein FlgD n=1 Tax=Amphritea opalescens TaxID=2490544 RepID=A0A430KU73_9GAMM|nr:flagellar hook capping FlgD N-terminal domain-containing protein [Amphritea opalescens]RTE66874.1 flagellar biosynthesis protein FlgD [Amphritea opalescens]